MKKLWKRTLSMLLVVIMVGGLAPLGALAEMDWPTLPDGYVSEKAANGLSVLHKGFAAASDFFTSLRLTASAESYFGTFGSNIQWQLDTDTGILRITGTGAMPGIHNNGLSPNVAIPWYEYRSYIHSVTIAYGITSIGDDAFYGCTSLISVKIPNSVIKIGDFAFNSCTSLINVTIPDSVTSIGAWAFHYCTRLTNIIIPNTVTSIDSHAFYACHSLESITIGSGVTSIGESAFSSCINLASVIIPNNVTSIGEAAFYSCTNLKSITIGNGVTSIGEYAFASIGLNMISVHLGNLNYSSDENGVLYNKTKTELIQYPVGNPRNVFTIPSSVTSIGFQAFSGCNSLTSVTIPNGVTNIGEKAFSGCQNLIIFTIPESVTNIGDYAFKNCYSLTNVTIPNGVTSIGEGVFSFSGLTDVTIQKGVINIGNGAFSHCRELKSIMIPNSVTSIGEDAFRYCERLVSVIIPESVTTIGICAFGACTNLNAITVHPNNPNYSSDDDGVLYNKTKTELIQYPIGNLRTAFTVPNSVERITDWAFFICKNLVSITIGKGVTHIGKYAFSECTCLTIVIFRNLRMSIYSYAFSNCIGLTDVYYVGSKEQWQKSVSLYSYAGKINSVMIHYNSTGPALSTRDASVLWKPEKLFSRDSSVYDPELAYVAGWLCDQSEAETDGDVGKGEQKMRAAFDALGFDANNQDVWYYGDTLCFGVASSEKDRLLVIVLRGTQSDEEAINDFTCGANKEMWGFHAYDYPFDFYKKVRDYLITRYIPQHTYLEAAPIKVLITGHSLGGAGANLLAFDMIKHTTLKQGNTWYEDVLLPENIYCYTFGALDSINDLYEDGSVIWWLPVESGYKNIHNIYNLKDTFGKYGVYPLKVNHIGEIVKKIGQMHFFSKDYGVDAWEYKEYSIGSPHVRVQIPEPTNTTNHNMPTYLDAIYYDTIGKASIPSDIHNTSNRKGIVVACPVDVEIFENGVLVGRTNRNVIDQTVTTIPLAIIDDVKYISLENNRDYRVIFRAFDEGEMSYTVYENGLTHPNDAAVFRDVALTEGKTMASEIGKAEPVEDVRLYVTNEAGEKTAEILPDGSEREINALRIAAPEAATYKKPFTVSAQIGSLPVGARVEWTANNAKVQLTPAADGKSCTVKSASKGTIMLTATVYDTDGETLAKESASVTVKYAWWQWLIRIFLLGFIWY